MAEAFQGLVNIYVRFAYRPRLDELKLHREIASRSSGAYDQNWLRGQIEEELDIINSDLEQPAPPSWGGRSPETTARLGLTSDRRA